MVIMLSRHEIQRSLMVKVIYKVKDTVKAIPDVVSVELQDPNNRQVRPGESRF